MLTKTKIKLSFTPKTLSPLDHKNVIVFHIICQIQVFILKKKTPLRFFLRFLKVPNKVFLKSGHI